MTLTILNVIYVLVALAMTVLILMQRGAGAQAGSGFGAGASGTVFGSKGASNFLSKSTKWLAIAFFVLSLGMGMFVVHGDRFLSSEGLGVMGEHAGDAKKDESTPASPASTPKAGDVPAPPAAAKASDVPEVVTPAGDSKTDIKASTPAATSAEVPPVEKIVVPNAASAPGGEVPASNATKDEKKKN
jgi:preprotein translocase subunit SecG